MAYVGGDIKEISVKNANVGSAVLYPKANEDNMMDLGGLRNADEANSITSLGEMIISKTYTRGSIEVTVANDQNTRKELVKIVKMASDTGLCTFTVSIINGTIWQGIGQFVGDLSANINKATFKVKIAVSTMTQIA